ncbi:MAG: zinc-dependent metalloprotease [Acidobacteriota bacterium]
MLKKALLTLVLFSCSAVAAAPSRLTIAVQPFGKVRKTVVAEVRSTLEATYRCNVSVLPTVPLPRSAWYNPRKRYRAEKLTAWLDRNTPRTCDKVIGVARWDISSTKGKYLDWGIFGYAELGGRSCVISTHRLRLDHPSAKLLHKRIRVITLHEIGHTLGLRHCPHRGCVMEDCRGTIKTIDRSTGRYCRTCAAKIAEYLK